MMLDLLSVILVPAVIILLSEDRANNLPHYHVYVNNIYLAYTTWRLPCHLPNPPW